MTPLSWTSRPPTGSCADNGHRGRVAASAEPVASAGNSVHSIWPTRSLSTGPRPLTPWGGWAALHGACRQCRARSVAKRLPTPGMLRHCSGEAALPRRHPSAARLDPRARSPGQWRSTSRWRPCSPVSKQTQASTTSRAVRGSRDPARCSAPFIDCPPTSRYLAG